MYISKKRFVLIFLGLAVAFQFISNSVLGPEVQLFPNNGDFFPGADAPIAWKRTVAMIIFPIKWVLIGPLSFLGQDPDPAPPVLLVAFAAYWTAIALVLHFLLSLFRPSGTSITVKDDENNVSKYRQHTAPKTKEPDPHQHPTLNRLEELYYEAKSDKWFRNFAVFCRVALAASFIPSGLVKIMGERFASGLPSNNPLGHYFDALQLTGYYYTFIGIVQVITAILLLIPRTSLLGALMYFPIILNICVLTYATRFAGTRLNTMMLLASLFLLIWHYDRLKYILPIEPYRPAIPVSKRPLGNRLRLLFFGGAAAVLALVIVGTSYLYEIGPGNSEAECRNQCAGSKNPAACQQFCDCIYKQGNPLNTCLATFSLANETPKSGK